MKPAHYIKIALPVIILMFACTERIDLPLESTFARLVVEGSITTDTTRHKVILSISGDALHKNPTEYVSNAVVAISDGEKEFKLTENPAKKGTYETAPTVYGIPDKTYTLHISNVDVNGDGIMETYSASSYLKNENPIDSIEIRNQQYGPNEKGWLVNMYAREIGGGRNIYLMKAYKNYTLLTDSTFEYTNLADNTGFRGGYYDGFPIYYLSSRKPDEKLKDGDIVTIEMDCISEEYYQFLLGFISEYYPKMPLFSGPSANISTNILPKDKTVGFFAAYSATRKSRVYREFKK
jgi:hypothetical protein